MWCLIALMVAAPAAGFASGICKGYQYKNNKGYRAQYVRRALQN